MARKVIKGVAKRYLVPGNGPFGYRPVWETGRASLHNRIKKVTGVDRPSV